MDGALVAQWLESQSGENYQCDLSGYRREKRSIPDSEKDEKYWEKRKRNNQAAKRSRENKRLMEMSTKEKATILERENYLLKREIEALKKRFGLPLDECFLSEDEQKLYDKEWTKKGPKRIKLEKVDSCGEEDSNSGPYPVALVKNKGKLSPGKIHQFKSSQDSDSNSSIENRQSRSPDSQIPNLQLYGMFQLAAAAQHRLEHGSDLHAPIHNPFQYCVPHTLQQPARVYSDHRPIDATVKRENKDDLKTRLAQLSAEVEDMKSLIGKNK